MEQKRSGFVPSAIDGEIAARLWIPDRSQQ